MEEEEEGEDGYGNENAEGMQSDPEEDRGVDMVAATQSSQPQGLSVTGLAGNAAKQPAKEQPQPSTSLLGVGETPAFRPRIADNPLAALNPR